MIAERSAQPLAGLGGVSDRRHLVVAPPLDADVEWVGDGPVPPEPVGNDDPAPGVP